MFSLFESLTHQEDFASQYRYMSEEEANKLFAQMVSSSDQNTYPLLNEEARKNGKPDILIIIMESFANDIMPSVGTHKDVAVCLDSIAQKGILFQYFPHGSWIGCCFERLSCTTYNQHHALPGKICTITIIGTFIG